MANEKVDIDLLKRNLRLSPQQRLEQHQSALNLVLALRKAKEIKHGKRSE